MIKLIKMVRWRVHLFSLVLLGAAFSALIAAFIIQLGAKEALVAAQNNVAQQQSINAEAERAKAVLNEYLDTYYALKNRGVIGEPQRLQWIEKLNQFANEFQIPQLNFILFPTQLASKTNTAFAHDTLQMRVTGMQLKFTVLHEGDFARLFDALTMYSAGLFSVQSCEMSRNEPDPNELAAGISYSINGFKGQCDLLWYSLDDITRQWEIPSP